MNTVKQVAVAAQKAGAVLDNHIATATAKAARDISPYVNNAALAVIQRNPAALNAPDFANQILAEITAHFQTGTAKPLSDAQLMSALKAMDAHGPVALAGFFSSIGHVFSSAYKSIKNAVVKVSHVIAKPLIAAAAVYLGQVYLLPAIGVGTSAGIAGASWSGFGSMITGGISAGAATVGSVASAVAPYVKDLIPSAVNFFAQKSAQNQQASMMAAQQAQQQQVANAQVVNNAAAVAQQYMALTTAQQQAYYATLTPTQQTALMAAVALQQQGNPATSATINPVTGMMQTASGITSTVAPGATAALSKYLPTSLQPYIPAILVAAGYLWYRRK